MWNTVGEIRPAAGQLAAAGIDTRSMSGRLLQDVSSPTATASDLGLLTGFFRV